MPSRAYRRLNYDELVTREDVSLLLGVVALSMVAAAAPLVVFVSVGFLWLTLAGILMGIVARFIRGERALPVIRRRLGARTSVPTPHSSTGDDTPR
jgi:hypothetical protein